jgi:tripartite-type tricarboxylate transporter receptor subunit TctC
MVSLPKDMGSELEERTPMISEALRTPDVQDRLHQSLLVPVGSTPEEAAAFLESERQRWRAIVEARAHPPK